MRPPEGRNRPGVGRGGGRTRGSTARAGDRRIERSRGAREIRRQRLAWALIGTILAVVIGILAYAYYANFIAPPRAQAAKVRDTTYTQGDLVKRLRLIRATTGSVDLGRAPWEVLFGMVEAELIRQGASFEGVVVTDSDVDDALRRRFYPRPTEGQEVEPGQLETEYQENYQNFLTNAQIKDDEYRVLVSDEVHRVALRETLGDKLPKHSEHLNISWIQVPHEVPDPENPPPTPWEILERLKVEDFDAVASDVGGGSGPRGWVPRGAYPDIDTAVFGADPPSHLLEGDYGVVEGDEATYVVRSMSLVEVRDVDEQWAEQVGEEQAMHMQISLIVLPENSADADRLIERLATEDFDDVAVDGAEGTGNKGWVPLGAYPELDDVIFGPQPLKVGGVSEPITGENATFIVTVLDGPEVREIEEQWLSGLKEEALQNWINEQWALGRQEGWVEVHTNSEQYRWVVDQYNKSVQEELEEQRAEGN